MEELPTHIEHYPATLQDKHWLTVDDVIEAANSSSKML